VQTVTIKMKKNWLNLDDFWLPREKYGDLWRTI